MNFPFSHHCLPEISYLKMPKTCDPIEVTLFKTQPNYSQFSHGNATPSSSTSLSDHVLVGSNPSGYYLSLATFAALILFISSERCCLAWISAWRFACRVNISCLSTFCDLLICHWFFSPCNKYKTDINSTSRLQSNLACMDTKGADSSSHIMATGTSGFFDGSSTVCNIQGWVVQSLIKLTWI